ncbi:MAG: hypothetical protein JWN80_2847 [Microbacteriaceae bacterium]|jgi:hypothetical protein|nr:hypothetical protein [Microbacteriaceae bacterium]
MTPPLARQRFDDYLAQLIASIADDDRFIGLVLMGSTAARGRVDEWSDHDFAAICASGQQESLRADVSWLPRHDHLVLLAREHHDGFKGVYDEGQVIEFAVTDLPGLATFFANDYEVAIDRGGVAETMSAVAAKPFPHATPNPSRDFGVFLTALLVGVGRARRGERLSANGSIRSFALEHLLLTIVALTPAAEVLDGLDVTRRFELANPQLARELDDALASELETAARSMLDLAEAAFTGWEDYPSNAVLVVRERLGWN